jgi:cytochrome b subunit of formate dehydrogenase
MRKGIYLFGLVIFLILAGLVEAVSGYILWFALPSGGGKKGLELTYWGFTRHTWIDIHDWAAVALTVVVVIHLLIHWKWVIRMTRQVYANFIQVYRDMKKAPAIKEN